MRIVISETAALILLAIHSIWKAKSDCKTLGKLSVKVVVEVWILYTLHALLTIFAAWQSLWPLKVNKLGTVISGFVLTVSGLVIFIAGIIEFRSFKRMSGLRVDKLVTTGVYRWSRNPQNVGWGFFLLGVSLIGKSFMALILVALFWLMIHIYLVYVEEERLEGTFGDDYRKRYTALYT